MVFGVVPVPLFVGLVVTVTFLFSFGVFAALSNNWGGGCIGAIISSVLAAIAAYMLAMVLIALPTPPINPPPGVTPGPNPTQITRPVEPTAVATAIPQPTAAPASQEPAPLAPAPTNAVIEIPSGSQVPAGTLVVERIVNHTARTVDVRATQLSSATVFGKNGQMARDGWQGYGSVQFAQKTACEQAQADKSGWAASYTVTYNGGAIPRVCN